MVEGKTCLALVALNGGRKIFKAAVTQVCEKEIIPASVSTQGGKGWFALMKVLTGLDKHIYVRIVDKKLYRNTELHIITLCRTSENYNEADTATEENTFYYQQD